MCLHLFKRPRLIGQLLADHILISQNGQLVRILKSYSRMPSIIISHFKVRLYDIGKPCNMWYGCCTIKNVTSVLHLLPQFLTSSFVPRSNNKGTRTTQNSSHTPFFVFCQGLQLWIQKFFGQYSVKCFKIHWMMLHNADGQWTQSIVRKQLKSF